MPKLIDYPRTTYSGAWELAEITDDTGGKCAIETAARKLNRKVSGSFKAIIGSAVKFGLLTSKRDLLTTTTLFKRIKHAYDKQEELLFHREAFLTPPLFTQLCRKFRSRELPVQMLDVMLIREFGVEEINAQGVAKAFVEGCRMVGLLDERNIIADIDALATQQSPRRELASPPPSVNNFRNELPPHSEPQENPNILDFGSLQRDAELNEEAETTTSIPRSNPMRPSAAAVAPSNGPDAIASLFGLLNNPPTHATEEVQPAPSRISDEPTQVRTEQLPTSQAPPAPQPPAPFSIPTDTYQIQVSGPGVNTTMSITDEEDITIAIALLNKIKRQLKA
ncbi:hypothetical protein ACFQT0_16890 [Hymenobacter humi]|uniref:Uncharacterized protein n=1 Tax=Hymenobacter humi TaxID=1411620 RepID=A0ABW2U7I1_9BACT